MARPKKIIDVVTPKKRAKRSSVNNLFTWEVIEAQQTTVSLHITRRAKIFNGWIVELFIDKAGLPTPVTSYQIHDPKHLWLIEQPVAVESPVAPQPTA